MPSATNFLSKKKKLSWVVFEKIKIKKSSTVIQYNSKFNDRNKKTTKFVFFRFSKDYLKTIVQIKFLNKIGP